MSIRLLDEHCDNCGWPLVQTNMKTREGIRHLNPDTGRWNRFGKYFEDGGRCPYPIKNKVRLVHKGVPHSKERTVIKRPYLHPFYFDMPYIMHHFWVGFNTDKQQSTLDILLLPDKKAGDQ